MTREAYTADFESFWSLYPKRIGSSKKLAFKCWKTRLKEPEVTVDLLMDCTRGYVFHCKQKGKLGTEYVMYAETFLGPNEKWLSYKPPVKPTETPSAFQVAIQADREALIEERIDPAIGKAFIREIMGKLAGTKGMSRV